MATPALAHCDDTISVVQRLKTSRAIARAVSTARAASKFASLSVEWVDEVIERSKEWNKHAITQHQLTKPVTEFFASYRGVYSSDNKLIFSGKLESRDCQPPVMMATIDDDCGEVPTTPYDLEEAALGP